MLIESLTVSMFSTNCYILGCPETKEAVIIDPGADGKGIVTKIEALGLTVQTILNTHGHVDHIGANSHLHAHFKVPIMISEKDMEIYQNPGFGLGMVLKKQPQPDRFLNDGDQITFGRQKLQVIDTPGHSPGGICLFGQGVLFCGDTLFAGSVGRTDLPGGSYDQLITSIKERLLVLPAETVVYPGHGPATTLAMEEARNPFLN